MVRLSLKEHCIETSARKEYKRLVSKYLKGEWEREIERKIEFLKDFLENTDFRRLRADRPELQGGKDVEVEVIKEGDTFLVKRVR